MIRGVYTNRVVFYAFVFLLLLPASVQLFYFDLKAAINVPYLSEEVKKKIFILIALKFTMCKIESI